MANNSNVDLNSYTETEMSSGWLPWSSLETLKRVFNVSSDEQGSHPDDISDWVSALGDLTIVSN